MGPIDLVHFCTCPKSEPRFVWILSLISLWVVKMRQARLICVVIYKMFANDYYIDKLCRTQIYIITDIICRYQRSMCKQSLSEWWKLFSRWSVIYLWMYREFYWSSLSNRFVSSWPINSAKIDIWKVFIYYQLFSYLSSW